MSRPSRELTALQEALPNYTVTGEIGRGAFGIVYAARHEQLTREVAIKQLPRAFAADPAVRERFVNEARMVAALDHPHIVPVYDFVDRDDGICLLIMERCQGALSDRFESAGLATDEACAAVLACCAALHFAHGHGVLHRDIKPENLMFDARGVIKLGDFGIARALDSEARRTATGMVIGTPAYMSPEQVRGEDLTPASDVYSVAIMTYELLTGALPFPESSTATGLLAHHLVTAPTPLTATKPELPTVIGAVIDRALSKDLAVHHSTALEFASDLTRACVRAFGTGWLRRRRFTLHWPEVLAESEQPDAQSVRTGTILVKADPNRDQLVGAAPPLPPPSPTAPSPAPPPTHPSPAAPSPAPSAPPPTHPSPAATRRTPLLVAGGIAATVALAVTAFALMGGSDDAATPDGTSIDTSGVTTVGESAPSSTSVSSGEPDPALSTRPAGLDMTVVDSPWTPTPCPEDQPRVACIFAGVSVDEATGQIEAPYFTEGFTPQLEPADYHLHFYLDTLVGGDERKAGAEVVGGSWKPWDGPSPFTSFGGPSGRTGFTVGDVQAAGARNLCVVVADAEQRAIPGSGNCAPIAQVFDTAALSEQVNRLEGSYIGRCGLGATLIVPDGWRWVDLQTMSVDEAAQSLRPTKSAEMAQVLTTLVDAGGVLWADGPVIDDFIVNLHVLTVEADVTTASTPEQVAAALAQRGVGISGATSRVIGGRPFLFQRLDQGASTSYSYVLADHGYALFLTITGPASTDGSELSDSIAATLLGC